MPPHRHIRLLAAHCTIAGYLIATLPAGAAAQSADTDRAALVAFYEATDGPNWTDSTNWLSSQPLDTWHGIRTDAEGRVFELWLPKNQLAGNIPAALASLTRLEHLNLQLNRLTGPIPPELGNLDLYQLLLDSNQLTGPIPPELASLTRLTHLALGSNQLTGPIPVELASLTRLVSLGLHRNALVGGIPAELGNLTDLRYLLLGGNRLTGPIPAALGNLTNLSSLSLDNDTGLCLASDFPLDTPYARLAQQEGVSVCTGATGPDLVVQSSMVSDDTLSPGQPFTLSVTVHNRGSAAAGPTSVRFYRSTDAGISRSDTEVGTTAVERLAAGGTNAPSIALTAPATVGIFWYGACVDSVADESDTDNNCSPAGSQVTVSAVTLPFTDDPVVPGVTAVKAVHLTELRERVDDLRVSHGLDRYNWTDPSLQTGGTPVKAAHLSDLRAALAGAYAAAGRTPDFDTGRMQPGGAIRAAHINTLRRAIEDLE